MERAKKGSLKFMACAAPACDGSVVSKGLCKLHYTRMRVFGSLDVKRPCLRGNLEQRFWRKVNPIDPDACWEWSGYCDKDGYGKIRNGLTNSPAHRVSYELHFGNLDPDKMVLHKCNNPPCVNPSHLGLGDQVENMQDRLAAGNYKLGELSHLAKYSNALVDEIRSTEGTYKQLSERFGVSESQIGNIKRGAQRRVHAD